MVDQTMSRDQNIKKWIKEISKVVLNNNNDEMEIEQKTKPNDLVTNMDKWVEKELVKKIRTAYPADRIVGEEGYGDTIDDLTGTVWFIDPIDGTLNFVLQNENFAMMLAVYENGMPVQSYVYDIVQDRLYSAIKDSG